MKKFGFRKKMNVKLVDSVSGLPLSGFRGITFSIYSVEPDGVVLVRPHKKYREMYGYGISMVPSSQLRQVWVS